MGGFAAGLADAAAGAGAFMRGGAQRAQDDLAIQNQKQQGELQGLQLSQGKLQMEEAQNQRNLEKALQEGYQSWIGKQKQAAGMDAANASTQQSAMLDYTKRVGEMSAGGSKPVGLGDAGPVPAQPAAPTEEGKASLYSHLAEIAARTPGGYRMAEELTKAHKMARDEGYLDATKVAMRGGDPEAVIQAFNKSGAMKVMPGTGYKDENGIYYAKTQDGKETSFNPRQWAVTFGLLKPEEFDVKDGVVFSKSTGANTPVQKQFAPNDYFLKLKDADGAEVAYDLRPGSDGRPIGAPDQYGLSKTLRNEINDRVLKGLGQDAFSGLNEENQRRYFVMVNMSEYLLSKGAVDDATGKPMTPSAAALVARDITDPKMYKSDEERNKALDSFLPKGSRRGTSGGSAIDPKTATLASVIEGMAPEQGAKFREKLEMARNDPEALKELNQVATGNPDSGFAERLLKDLGEQAPTPASGAGLPTQKASTQPKPQLPRPEPARLQRMSKQELAGMVNGMDKMSSADQEAIRKEVEGRGMLIRKVPFMGQSLQEPDRPAPSTAAALDVPPPDGPSRTQPGLGEAGAASTARPAVPAAGGPGLESSRPTPPNLIAPPTIPIRPSAGKAPSTKPPTTTKPGATPKSSATPGGLADAPNGYEATRRQAGKGATPEKQGAGSKPATDPALAKRRSEASTKAASKFQSGDLQWFQDNMAFLSPKTRQIYIDAINKRLERDGFGNPAMKGKRVTVKPNLPEF